MSFVFIKSSSFPPKRAKHVASTRKKSRQQTGLKAFFLGGGGLFHYLFRGELPKTQTEIGCDLFSLPFQDFPSACCLRGTGTGCERATKNGEEGEEG